jgi:L-seryl-tRNA(Ser) seleniumtransferase
MEDQGTGCIGDLSEFGIARESSFAASARSGVAVVCASGDKLLGGPQCGLIVGDPQLIEKLRKNPLYRALRVDKLTLAAMQATLLAYVSNRSEGIPALAILRTSADEIGTRCTAWAEILNVEGIRAVVVPCRSVLGGGTTAGSTVPSFAVSLAMDAMSADSLAARLRTLEPPVIARINDGYVQLDLRTVPEDADQKIPQLIRESLLWRQPSGAMR